MKLVDRLGQEITAGCIVVQVLSGNTFAIKVNQSIEIGDHVLIRELDCNPSWWTRDFIIAEPAWSKFTEVIG